MCFQIILVFSQPRSNITRRWQRNPANLRPFSTSSSTPLSLSMCFWNCQSDVNKAGTPLLVFGDFNNHLDKPYATDFHSLLASFDLKRLTTTSTHKSGNQLDLIYTRNCTADNILVQPLHISDHFFITFILHFATRGPPTPLLVTFRQNLCSLSPSHLSYLVSSSLPSPTHFSSMYLNP